MIAILRRGGLLAALLAAAGLSGCGSAGGAEEGPGLGGIARQAVSQVAAGRGAAKAPAAAPANPEAMAAEALRVNPGPLILAGLERMGTTQVLAMVGENQGMRTYMTKNEQALILRDGLLVGTRGLGHDLSVAEAGTAPLIRARQAGSAKRVMRVYTGEGLEGPIGFDCTVSVGAGQSFGFAGRSWGATRVSEQCRAGALTIENSYLVAPGGQIPVSRQWVSPGLGYVTLQVIRP